MMKEAETIAALLGAISRLIHDCPPGLYESITEMSECIVKEPDTEIRSMCWRTIADALDPDPIAEDWPKEIISGLQGLVKALKRGDEIKVVDVNRKDGTRIKKRVKLVRRDPNDKTEERLDD